MTERKEYLVQVTVIEGRHLKNLGTKGTSDPYVKITCGNLSPQVTIQKEKTSIAIWNQSFTFKQLMMNEYELETWELFFEVYDRNTFLADSLIGASSIGLGTMYRNTNHEFFRCWLSLFNTQRPKESQGYLMVSCYILGPSDQAPIHTENDVGRGDIERIKDNIDGIESGLVMRDDIHVVDRPNLIERAFQLSISIYKGEDFPADFSTFFAVRCMGTVLKTPIVDKSYSPIFQTTLLFPVYTPFLNDNVSIKLWSYVFGRTNQCLAQVCDEYGPNSEFNLHSLMKVGKIIGTRWYNLYGVREDHRAIYGKRTREGKEYIGRVLMRVSLLSTDSPQLGTARSTIGREPLSVPYILFVDVFELRNVNGLGQKIWVQASIGNKTTPKSAYPKFIKDERAFVWENFEAQKLQMIEINVPVQPDQCPDIFVYLWQRDEGLIMTSEKLVGYARLKAKNCIEEAQKTRWITIKPINSPNADSPGELLANIHFSPKGSEMFRGPVEFEKKNYRLTIRIKSGFYMAPEIKNDDDIETHIEVFVGRDKQGQTPSIKGRYPIWNYCTQHKLMLKEDLKYEGDLLVLAYKKIKGIFGEKEELLGQFALKLLNIRATRIRLNQEGINANYFKEYYNLVRDSVIHGRILAFFDLEECNSDQETVKITDGLTIANVEQLNIASTEVKISITVLCIRELIKQAKKPLIKFKLTNDTKEYSFTVNKERIPYQDSSNSLYVLNTIEFNANVPDNISDWPFLQIQFVDEAWLGCNEGFTTLLLFPYADFISDSDKKATINMFNVNTTGANIRSRSGSSKGGYSLSGKLSHRSIRTVSGSQRTSKSSKSMLSLLSSTEPLSVIEDADELLDEVEEKIEEVDESKSRYNKSVVSNRIVSVNDLRTLKDDVAEEEQLMDELYKMHFQELEIIPCTRTDKKNMRDATELRLKEFEAIKSELISVSLLLITSLR